MVTLDARTPGESQCQNIPGDTDLLFYAYNGTGLGHLRRIALLCGELLRIRPALRLVVATNARLAHFLSTLPITILHTPYDSIDEETISHAREANSVYLDKLLRATQPRVLVCDTLFFPSLPTTARRHGGRSVLIQRMISSSVLLDRLRSDYYEPFDQIIFPHSTDWLGDVWAAASRSRIAGKVFADGFVFAAPTSPTAADAPFELVATLGGGGPYFTTSNGAAVMNTHGALAETVLRALTHLSPRVQHGRFCFSWGPNGDPDLVRESALRWPAPHLTITAWLADLPGVLPHCRLCIARCGYNTVCELVAARCPALFIPRAGRTESQLDRARWLSDRGACVLCAEDDPNLEDRIKECWEDDSTLARIRARLNEIALPSGTGLIAQRLVRLLDGV